MPLNEDAVNEILPFAPDGLESSGDLIALGEYAGDDMRKRGHQPGLARRGLQNRAQRQAAHVAAGVAQFVANRHAAGVRDDGDLDAVEEGLKDAVREEAEVVRDDSCRGFTSEGQHVAYEADIAAIDRNSLYAVRKGVAVGLPADMPADAWAFVHTMVMPGDAARTQLLWSVDDPDHPGWWRRRAAGAWGEWKGVGADLTALTAALGDKADISWVTTALNGKVDKSAWVTLVAGRAWKLPNGLIFQFGTYTGLAYDQSVTITLPAAMPTGGLWCAGSDDDTGSNLAVVLAKFMSTGSIRLTNDTAQAVTGGRTISGKWIAVGY